MKYYINCGVVWIKYDIHVGTIFLNPSECDSMTKKKSTIERLDAI